MDSTPRQIPGRVVGALALAIVLDTITHVAWKLAVGHLPEGATIAAVTRTCLTSPLFWVAMVAFLVQFYNWMRVLEHADLSFAQPITALGYIAVLAISMRALHEPVSATRVAGVALILAGVYFISRTPFRTTSSSTP